jgi:3',5'-cyclic-AMP phosphodiesterase
MRIVHLSDSHVSKEGKPYLPGVDLADRCRSAVRVCGALKPGADLVILGGDMLDDGPSPDYRALAGMLDGIAAPVHLCLGNHDSLEGFRRAPLPTFPTDSRGWYSFRAGDFRVIILFTASERRGKGNIDRDQLDWLQGELEAAGRALIFMHHPPVSVGIAWLDAINVENSSEFWAVVEPFAERIDGIFFAHVHMQLSLVRNGILLASPPAAGWQFRADPLAAKAETSNELPGFNVIDTWNADSSRGAGAGAEPLPGLSVRTIRFQP